MKPLIVHRAALAELEEAVTYHEAQVDGLGRDLRREVARAFERLQAHPGQCPPHGRTGLRKCFVSRFRYTFFFLELPASVWVAAVAHGSRRPGHWRHRKTDDAGG